ncbi:MAG: hypothetical protein IPK65_08640 [Gammaproteobacteria bacterium]|nr:hypothetical protein [Gammaproteobacteria bacterium]
MPKSRAVVTLAIGDLYERMGQITHPLMQLYAQRHNAEFVTINQPKVQVKYGLDNRYDKFQLYELLDRFEQIAFFDSDILIAPDAPSIYDMVPIDVFGAANEESFSLSKNDKEQTQEILGKIQWKNVYFNSGVMVFGKSHQVVFDPKVAALAEWAEKKITIPKRTTNDQAYLNYRINQLNVPFLDLGYRFNHTRVITATQKRFRSWMIHYSGASGHRYGDRVSQIEKDSRIMKSPSQLWLSRKYPFWRWFSDRLDKDFVKYLFTEKIGRG